MNPRKIVSFLNCVILLTSCQVDADTIYVNQRIGNNAWTGKSEEAFAEQGPVKSIQRSIELAKPGDTIVIVSGSGPYHEAIRIKGHPGEPEKPITIEGNDVVVDLGMDIANSQWSHENGLWVLDQPRIPPKTWGMGQRVTAFYKGRGIRFYTGKEDFREDFTASLDEEGRLHFQFPHGMKPPFTGLVLPQRPTDNALGFSDASYWILKNIHIRYAGNDGFNFHGHGKGMQVINCSAIFCGDEGISSHETMEVVTRDSLFALNGSGSGGVVDVHESETTYINCISAYNRGAGYVMRGGKHVLENCLSAANERLETDSVLSEKNTRIKNLETIPAGPDAIEAIKAWNADHPQLPRLLETIEELKAQDTELVF